MRLINHPNINRHRLLFYPSGIEKWYLVRLITLRTWFDSKSRNNSAGDMPKNVFAGVS